MKLVSVIITTHKGSEYIQRAIESVLSQEYKNIELIVVDDNGIDSHEQKKTYETIEQYLTDKRVKYIAHEVNINGAAARNTGFKGSKGEYITFLDDDDFYFPQKISAQVKTLEELDETWGMAYCSVLIRYGNGKTVIRKSRKSGELLFDLLVHSTVIGSDSLLIRRGAYEKLNGFDESFFRHQDYEFTARVAANFKVVAVPVVGFEYNKTTNRNDPRTIEIAQEYRRHYIDKMIPYIKTLSKKKQYIVIYSNALEVTSFYLRKGELRKFLQQFVDYTSRWVKCISLTAIFSMLYLKAKHRFKRQLQLIFAKKG
ncbi:glycosyltransferase family 2 protein [Bacillus sp. es.034]|uniref:glycosyltransferase family 2 protein n=1 Tax=Bacillus sp. es.034 TaxID=1761763 RepID=UPI000C01DB45|nr:glycosyltransferase family 2 protein [Bacillus sp. es.034]PFG04478.1 GT2 family glycosyltransferase [Bacillus sp. es.034]